MENKLIDMREMYDDRKEKGVAVSEDDKKDPFYETQEDHNLIGVANIFLDVLFHDVKLDYHTPIISQQGEVAGRLQVSQFLSFPSFSKDFVKVELSRVAGVFPQDRICEAASDNSSESSNDEEEVNATSTVTCRVHIKQASGLPLSLSHFVFCQYTFWNHPDPIVVPHKIQSDHPINLSNQKDSMTFKFNHVEDFTVPITEEFLEHCAGLLISLMGHPVINGHLGY